LIARLDSGACYYGSNAAAQGPCVHNGRLVLDEPTDLPEGEVIELVPLDEVLARSGDYLDDDERAALHRELDASVAEAEAGQLVDIEDALAELRAMR
jgi:hypothetical protein